MEPTHEQIAVEAYRLWQQRCLDEERIDYSDELAVQDWLLAEQWLKADVPAA